jgi:hypothetical protein
MRMPLLVGQRNQRLGDDSTPDSVSANACMHVLHDNSTKVATFLAWRVVFAVNIATFWIELFRTLGSKPLMISLLFFGSSYFGWTRELGPSSP